jgi:hypothetical protein
MISETIHQVTKIFLILTLLLFRDGVLPILFYGCESWHLTRAQAKKVSAFEMKCLRKISVVKWYHRITNDTIRQRTQRSHVTSTINLDRQLTFSPSNQYLNSQKTR